MTILSRFVIVPLLLCSALTLGALPQGGLRTRSLLEKDLSAFAGGDLVLNVGEVVLAPGAIGAKHRHPSPTLACVLEGAVEVELEGVPAKVYRVADTFYEDAHPLHISTQNVSQTGLARILAYPLSRKGEKLTEPEK